MWAQLIKVRLKPGKDLAEAATHLRAAEQPGSGLVREMFMRRAGHGRGDRRAGCAALRHDRPTDPRHRLIDSAVPGDKALDRRIGQARSYVAGLPMK